MMTCYAKKLMKKAAAILILVVPGIVPVTPSALEYYSLNAPYNPAVAASGTAVYGPVAASGTAVYAPVEGSGTAVYAPVATSYT